MAGIVLTGVDDSETAFEAAEKAATLAIALEFELHVISAFSTDEAGLPQIRHSLSRTEVASVMQKREDMLQGYEDAAYNTALAVADNLHTKFPQLNIVAKAVAGGPAPAIINQAQELDADVVVVGNKRVQGAGRILGSIATAVSREIECDLYIANTHKR